MGDVYLTEMANWFRQAGLSVIEFEGWKTRARGSGGYSDSSRPWCVMWHHTASGASMDGQGDASYCAVGDEDAPLANAYIDRSGTVWCLAAGATNTNGSGNPTSFSKGIVPENSMNSYAFGVELGNNGSGEEWPQAQIDAMFILSNTVNAKCGNKPDDVCTHQMYAPSRKVDPATAAAVQGPWKPRSCTGSGTWNCDDIKAECLSRAGARVITHHYELGAIHDEGDTMFIAVKDGKYWIGNGLGRRLCDDTAEVDFLIEKFSIAGTPLVNLQSGKPVTDRGQIAGAKQVDRLGVNVEA